MKKALICVFLAAALLLLGQAQVREEIMDFISRYLGDGQPLVQTPQGKDGLLPEQIMAIPSKAKIVPSSPFAFSSSLRLRLESPMSHLPSRTA